MQPCSASRHQGRRGGAGGGGATGAFGAAGGIGGGVDAAGLHTPDYQWNDTVTEAALRFFTELIKI